MIDLHCHILPKVDDGSRSMDETIEILRKAEKAGFNIICFTPHYAEPQYLKSKRENIEVLREVIKNVRQRNMSINLLLGNEIFINDNIVELLKNRQISSLNNTKYVLIELPMYQEMSEEVVRKLLNNVKKIGGKVVIAHPERYVYFQKDPKRVLEYFDDDIIFQGNYASIIGAYGRETQKTMKKLLKMKVIDYLASDVHQSKICFYDNMDEIKKKLLKVVDKDYFKILTEINPRLVIGNRDVVKK